VSINEYFKNPSVIKKCVLLVFLLSLVASVCLTVSVWDINFWPTDAEAYYLPAATKLFSLSHISQMHEALDEARTKWLHGKEIFILASAAFQRLLSDETTLRPLILVCIFAVGLSSILVFFVTRFYWGTLVGLACFFIFTTCFWPYQYVLFVKHQPLGLFFFLLSVFLLQQAGRRNIFYVFSGASLCLAIYSSTVSSLYIPYYLAVLFLIIREDRTRVLLKTILGIGGFLCVFFYVNYPDMIGNIKSYWEYVQISSSYNHFYYNQPVLRQWIEHPDGNVRGGWPWIIKYFLLIMPVLFPLFIFCVGYLIKNIFSTKKLSSRFAIAGLILLSVSGLVLAEVKQVAQYGANYFSFLVGIIMLTGYSLFIFLQSEWFKKASINSRRLVFSLLVLVFITNCFINAYLYFGDVYPSRMATTFLSREIKKRGIAEVYTYAKHPYKYNMVDCLDPALLKELRFVRMANISQPQAGVILMPPVTGKSIYRDINRNTYNDFDEDIFLNELWRKGNFYDYVLASFPTLSSSRIWPHEEEVLSYKYLMLGQIGQEDLDKGRVWLLDAKRIYEDQKENIPSAEFVHLVRDGVRNIGTQKALYMFEGNKQRVAKPVSMDNLSLRIYKVGNPKDSLVAYLYGIEKEQPVWIPSGKHYASYPVPAVDIAADPFGASVQFRFPEALALEPGPYNLVVYRTGALDDSNFYRIYINE